MDSPVTELDHLRAVVQRSGLEIERLVTPDMHFQAVDGLHLRVLDWGVAGRPPVVFIHGGGLTAHTWDVVCLALRERYHCVAYDQRGHGDSDWAPDGAYSLDEYGADVGTMLDRLGLERVVLVGMSLGGLASIWYAGRHAERLAGLVLVDCGPTMLRLGADKIMAFTGDTGGKTLDEHVERALRFNPARSPDLLRFSLMRNLREHPEGGLTPKFDPDGHGPRQGDRMMGWAADLWDVVGAIDCPALVVRGERSDVFSDELAAELAAALPSGRWAVVENAGHTVQGDNPAGLLRVLEPFLAALEPWP
jgi:pimeloyl-ACP methyl ester carboxylesterase